MSSLRSWSAKKKTGDDSTTKVEELKVPEEKTELKKWAKGTKVSPEFEGGHEIVTEHAVIDKMLST